MVLLLYYTAKKNAFAFNGKITVRNITQTVWYKYSFC